MEKHEKETKSLRCANEIPKKRVMGDVRRGKGEDRGSGMFHTEREASFIRCGRRRAEPFVRQGKPRK